MQNKTINGIDTEIASNGSAVYSGKEVLYYNNTLLYQLNHERMLFNVPVIVVLFVIMFIGFFGNILVIVIYKFFSPKTPANFYILFLAAVDIMSCVFCIPFHIYKLWNPYVSALPIICCISRFLEGFFNLTSGFILVSVASERYFKISLPLMPYEMDKAKKISVVISILAVVLSLPQLHFNKETIMLIGKLQVVGQYCGALYGNSMYLFLYQGFLFLVYLISYGAFAYFYGRIVIIIIKRRMQIKANKSKRKDSGSMTQYLNSGQVTGIRMRSSKTTVCLATITFTVMTGYVPFLTIMLIRTSGVSLQTTVTPSGEYFHYGSSAIVDLACTLCVKSYFINSALNPVIYSVLNPAFRFRTRQALKMTKGPRTQKTSNSVSLTC
ncbi:hypothetical protein LOTGIDRAFT_161360 [Lottia gigantea]|uniref:G-protein coupled receptors family 1 profile domain-containing protein n=1 Tax=Lottia gigantea TaxID=225164 RepID=V3ZRV5_LOTGI|nr:hypothetical protein LOTGIDRAFT_161360 [Lottia gigantea]ESO94158.1 hypothetical protein LOTGIDRAFT_161360 [Lottia gigantea]